MMDLQILGFALYETLLSVACGLVTIWIVIQGLQRSIGPKSPALAMKQGNTAVAVFYGAVIMCVLIVVQPCITSSVNTLRIMASSKEGITLVIRPSTDRLIQSLVSYDRLVHATPADERVLPQP